MVIKRNGHVVELDLDRIKNALSKAVRAGNQKIHEEVIKDLVDEINTEVIDRFIEFYPNVENIQDIVEKHLMRKEFYEVAKCYILYRAERQKSRDEEQQKTIEKTLLGKLKVKKGDGRIILLDSNKLKKTIDRIINGYEKEISADLIMKETLKNLFDGMSTKDIDNTLILASASLIEKSLSYTKIAYRFFLQKLYKEVIGNSIIIDEKSKTRDILKESIVLTNDTGRKLNVYTFVNNVAIREGLDTSLANWIEIPRGVIEILPNEKKKIDFMIRVNLRAHPGIYHAVIIFAEGSTRDIAEKKLASAPSVMINLEVIEDIKERLQLKKFIPDKILFSGLQAAFSYELENIGNKPLEPSGEIRIYNKGGKEITSFDANQDASFLEPDTTMALASLGSVSGFGRYKAVLDLEYGTKQRGTIQDTVFFWIMPWKFISIILSFLIMFTVSVAYLVHCRHLRRAAHYRILRKYAQQYMEDKE